MAVCAACSQEMQTAIGCTQVSYDDFADGIERDRIRYGNETQPWVSDPCHDCATVRGAYHHPGCDVEECPACHGQAISCDCAKESEEEWNVGWDAKA